MDDKKLTMGNGQLGAGWRVERLGAVCEVIAGQSPQGKFYNDTGTGTPFYQGKKEFGDKFIRAPKKWTSHTTKMAYLNDILMSVRAPVGPINFATQSLCIGRGLAAIRAGGDIDKDFLFYQLLSKQNEIKGNEGAVFASINKAQIESLEISLPSLLEQKRIVAILDEAFTGISLAVANAEKNLTNARELFESYLNNVFTQKGDGWEEKMLDDVIQITHGFAFKGADFEVSSNEECPIVLTPGNYTEDASLSFTDKNTKRLMIESPDSYLFAKGDLTIVMTDLSSKMKILGKPAFIENEFILHNQRIGRILFKEPSLDKRFLYYYLQTRQVSDNIKETATGTMVRHTAPVRILSNQVCFPVISGQKEIVEGLDLLKSETQRLEVIYQQKLTALNELKQSILQKAFTGELTQREENV